MCLHFSHLSDAPTGTGVEQRWFPGFMLHKFSFFRMRRKTSNQSQELLKLPGFLGDNLTMRPQLSLLDCSLPEYSREMCINRPETKSIFHGKKNQTDEPDEFEADANIYSAFGVSVRFGKVIEKKGVALDSEFTYGSGNLDYYKKNYLNVA